MKNFFSKYKFIFYLMNFILIFLYLFPGSILGKIIYDDFSNQPQITVDFVVSANHVYAFLILSVIGFFTYKNSTQLNIIIVYLISLSIILEISHLFIPGRSFQYSDLFGNLFGVIIMIIISLILKKYENFKN